MPRKMLLLAGIAGPVLYAFSVVLGGALRPGYSHVGQAVSELIEAGAPNKTLLDALFAAYNVLVGLFGIGLLREEPGSRPRLRAAGALALAATAFVGLLMPLFFPMDPRGAAATVQGTLHLVLAGLSSLGSMASILLAGLWLAGRPGERWASTYSFASLAAVFVTGGLAAASASQASPVMGLLERLTIGFYLQWIVVLAAAFLARPAHAADVTQRH